VGLAEDLAQDALLVALEKWPQSGIPDNPAAWLMGTAKHRAIDALRRNKMHDRKSEEIARELESARDASAPDMDAALDDHIGDDLLRLIFTTCHPVLSTEARVALTLRLLGGLTTPEIARAFLVPEPTIAQRIVRAKKTLAEARVPFEVPRPDELPERLASVLEVVYAIFNEGYTGTSSDDWMRPALMQDALRLGRMLGELARHDSEVQGLLALMELQASRAAARVDAQGRPVLLTDQDRSRWDRLLIRRGTTALERARSLAVAARQPRGPYALQAPIAGSHPRATHADDTHMPSIVALYDALVQAVPSPVVQLNRAVAVGMAFGPEAALEIVDALRDDKSLRDYQWLPSVRADLLAKMGRHDEARVELLRAAELARNARERGLLLDRAASLRSGPTSR
jgi:RNA polymerase sigma factor (sigma-70 family)